MASPEVSLATPPMPPVATAEAHLVGVAEELVVDERVGQRDSASGGWRARGPLPTGRFLGDHSSNANLMSLSFR